VPDREDSAAAIACRSLEPLLDDIHDTLVRAGAHDVAHDVLTLAAEAYALGHRDGVRHAVAEIAPVADAHGLRLWLGPELCEEDDDGHVRPGPERLA
jgi:hypothetical protein